MPCNLRDMELHLRSIHEISRPFMINVINDITISKPVDEELIELKKNLSTRLNPVLGYEPMMVDSTYYKLLLNIFDGQNPYGEERHHILEIIYKWVSHSKSRYYGAYVAPVIKIIMNNKPPSDPNEQLTDKTIYLVE